MKNRNANSFSALICWVPFLVLSIVTICFFRKVYLLEWMLRHAYLGLWAIAFIVALSNPGWGYAISVSNFVAVLIGTITGDYIRNRNILKITSDMKDWQVMRMYHNPGFEIWLGIFLLELLLYAIFLYCTKVRGGKLLQINKNTETINAHRENTSHHMESYVDTHGIFHGGFYMNEAGVIDDEHTQTDKQETITKVESVKLFEDAEEEAEAPTEAPTKAAAEKPAE